MNIENFLKQSAEMGDEYTLEFAQALQGDTTRVAEVWRGIASGEMNVACTLMWAQHVAGRIQAEVMDADLSGVERPRAALAAIGFRGPVDKHRAVKEDLITFADFFPDATNPEILEFLQRRGHLQDMPRNVALTRIAEWRK